MPAQCADGLPCKENRERCICALTKISPTFKGLNRDVLHEITTMSSLKLFQKDEIIFFENQACKYLYLLLSGKIKVYKSSETRELILRILEPTTIFAEAPVYDEIPFYNASATAIEDSEVMLIDKEKFKELAKKSPVLMSNLLSLFSSRIRTLDNQIECLNLKSVEARLANYLLELSPVDSLAMNQLKLPTSKTTLASILGTVIETLSRAFKSLKKSGLIEIEDSNIQIKDYDKLEELAGK